MKKETRKINFNDIAYLTHYIQNIIMQHHSYSQGNLHFLHHTGHISRATILDGTVSEVCREELMGS